MNDKPDGPAEDQEPNRRDKPSLDGETIEARILMSATWITGDITDNTIDGSDADDALNGFDGNDLIQGGAGNDTVRAGGGNDVVRAGSGDDSLDGGAGTDALDYSQHESGVGVDLEAGTTASRDGDDTFVNFEGVVGSAHADRLSGSSGTDAIHGGAGNDTVFATAGGDRLDGGDGRDTLSFVNITGPISVDLTSTDPQTLGSAGTVELANFENVIGTNRSDTFLFTNAAADRSFSVDGGGGDGNIIDLSDHASASATLSSDSVTIDLEGGGSFRINFENIDRLRFRDGTVAPPEEVTVGGLIRDLLTFNATPTAEAGADQTVTEGDTVSLSAVDSYDKDGDWLTFSWVQTGGPAVVLDDANAIKPTFTAPEGLANSTITFELRVTDGVVTATDSVTITVNADDDAPIADAGVSQIVDEGDVVTLTGVGSSDPEGQGLTYTWTQISGPSVTLSDASAAQPTFTAPDSLANTNLQFQLQVSDGTTVSVDTVSVQVNADNDAPTASAGGNQTVDEGDVVTLTGAGSSDPEGQGLTYTWTQVSGPAVTLSDANAAQPTFTAPEGLSNATVQFQLQVSDGTNTSSVDTVSITVNADNDLPTANAGSDQTVDEGDLVTLSGIASSDPEGQGLTYTWVQTGGPLVTLDDASSAQPTFTAPEGLSNATVQFQLQVTDGVNTSSVDTVSITIQADNDGPISDAGIDQTVDEGDLVTLTGISSADPEGQVLTYSWTQTGGPAVTLSDASAAQPTFTAPNLVDPTQLTFELEVNDGTSSHTDTVQITIRPADLLGRWTFDGVGQTVVDSSGNGNDGNLGWLDSDTQADPTRVVDGTRDEVLEFDGTQFVDDIGQGPSGSFTISAWANYDSGGSGWQTIYSSGDVETSLKVDTDTGTIFLAVGGSGGGFQSDPGVVSADTWQHISGTWNGTTGKIYVDGAEITSTQAGSPTDPVAADAAIGARHAGAVTNDLWQGRLDDVRVYGDALSAGDVFAMADNDPPIGDAGIDQTVDEGDLVTLDGTASSDAQGSPLTYSWTQISGPAVTLSDASAAQPTFTAPEGLSNSTVQFRLVVNDGVSNSLADTVSITVNADDDAPTADAGSDQTVDEGDVVTLTGITSSDPEGQGLTYSWTQVSGPAVTLSDASAAQPTFTAPEGLSNATVQFQLQVGDGVNTSSVDTVSITVNADDDAPTADAGIDQTVDEGDLVTLTGVTSSDPEGQGLTYSWTQIGGPAVTLSDASAAQPTFTAPEGVSNATVRFQLQVSDGVNTSSVDTVSIAVNADNDAPTADAGIDQTVDEGDLVTLTGVTSSDPEGQGLTYSWTQISGPAVTLSDPTAAQPTFTAPEGLGNSTVQFQLQVSDGANVPSADTVSITVNADDDAPTSDAGEDRSVTEGAVVTLDGTGSTDPEGVGLVYTWTQVSGPTVVLDDASAASPSFTAPQGVTNTTVQFQLQVGDGVNTSSVDTVSIVVNAVDDAPTANAGFRQDVREGDVVTLNGAASSDAEGQSLTYLWRQIGGPTVVLNDPTSASPSFSAPDEVSNTEVTFELQVSDGVNVSSLDTVSIGIGANDDAPTAEAGIAQLAREGDVVTLDGTGSSDPEGRALTYQWVQVSGPTVELDDPQASRPTFTAPEGLRNTAIGFQLTVSDGANTSSDSVTIVVQADNDAPSVDAGRDRIALHGSEVQLNATASDPEGQGLSYQWQQVGGPTVEIVQGDTSSATFRAPNVPEGAILTFVVGVDDGENRSFDTVRVMVAPNEGPNVSIRGTTEVDAGNSAAINAIGVDREGDALTYRWTQTAGPNVTLSGDQQATLMFQAPDVSSATTLSFQVEVSDGHRTTTQTVQVSVAATEVDEPITTPGQTTTGAGDDSPPVTTPVDAPAAREPVADDAGEGATDDVFAADPTSSLDSAGSILSLMGSDTSTASTATSDQQESLTLASARLTTDSSSDVSASEAERDAERSLSASLDGDGGDSAEFVVSELFADSAAAAAVGTDVRLTPDLVVADAGDQLELRPRGIENLEGAAIAEIEQVNWSQTAGTPVDIATAEGGVLQLTLPTVFVEEEVVFEVELVRGGERIVQEVAVQVQPVAMTSRSLAIDEHLDLQADETEPEEEQGSRGFGKIWGALLAFFGASGGRRKE